MAMQMMRLCVNVQIISLSAFPTFVLLYATSTIVVSLYWTYLLVDCIATCVMIDLCYIIFVGTCRCQGVLSEQVLSA